MKLNINTNTLKEGLESIQVKGKYVNKGGLSSGSLDDVFYLSAKANTVSLWGGNNTFLVNIELEAEIETEGGYIGRAAQIIPYLKNFGEEVTLELGDFLSLSSGSKKASVPRVVEWANIQAIDRLGPILSKLPVVMPTDKLPHLSPKTQFEGGFILNSDVFTSAISSCELVKSGVYKIDLTKESLKISSTDGPTNSYVEEIEPVFRIGDPATVEFSSPLHKFFKKDQLLTFYVLDDAPIVIISDDRRLVKAPYIAGV